MYHLIGNCKSREGKPSEKKTEINKLMFTRMYTNNL